MPQPLSKVQGNAGAFIANAGDRPFTKRPQLAVWVAEAINSWSNVEAFHLKLFVRLFGGDSALATGIYLSLEARGPKSAALRAAIDTVPDLRTKSVIKAVLAIAKTAERERDKLAHHAWGYSTHPKLTDALLLMDAKNAIKIPLSRDDIYVYREADLKKIVQTNDLLCRYGLNLLQVLNGDPANKSGQLLDWLCNQPAIKEKLDHEFAPDGTAIPAAP